MTAQAARSRVLEKGDPSREALVRSLVRLAHRMIHGRDPARPRARA